MALDKVIRTHYYERVIHNRPGDSDSAGKRITEVGGYAGAYTPLRPSTPRKFGAGRLGPTQDLVDNFTIDKAADLL
jgi:hypothetical protein